MSFFIAVIFYCNEAVCEFAYSQLQYQNRETCMASLNAEMASAYSRNPTMMLRGSCLEFRQQST